MIELFTSKAVFLKIINSELAGMFFNINFMTAKMYFYPSVKDIKDIPVVELGKLESWNLSKEYVPTISVGTTTGNKVTLNPKSVDQSDLIYIQNAAIQKLEETIKSLEKRVKDLEGVLRTQLMLKNRFDQVIEEIDGNDKAL